MISLQEVRRNGQRVFTATGYVLYCSGANEQKHEKNGNHKLYLAVRESMVAGMDKDDVAVGRISARLEKVCTQLK